MSGLKVCLFLFIVATVHCASKCTVCQLKSIINIDECFFNVRYFICSQSLFTHLLYCWFWYFNTLHSHHDS